MVHGRHVLVYHLLVAEVAVARIAFEVGGYVTRGVHVLLTRLPAGRELAPARSVGGHSENVGGVL